MGTTGILINRINEEISHRERQLSVEVYLDAEDNAVDRIDYNMGNAIR